MAKLVKSEEKAKKMLEGAGWKAVKAGWPDFIVYNPETLDFCFVEVKRTWNDRLTPNQSTTFPLLRKLKIPTVTVFLEVDDKHNIETIREAIKESWMFMNKKDFEAFKEIKNKLAGILHQYEG